MEKRRAITSPTVTGNSQLLLGVIAASISGGYDPVEVDAENAKLIVRSQTGNRFVIKVRQIEGLE